MSDGIPAPETYEGRHMPVARAISNAPLLRLSGITKTYGPTRAIDGLSFTVAAGDIVGLIGANGAGKSTLMRVLAGVTMPDTGELEIDGRSIDFASFSPQGARKLGIRIVHQGTVPMRQPVGFREFLC